MNGPFHVMFEGCLILDHGLVEFPIVMRFLERKLTFDICTPMKWFQSASRRGHITTLIVRYFLLLEHCAVH